MFPTASVFIAVFLNLDAWPPRGPQWRLDKPLTSIIKCGAETILNLTLHSQLSYHVSLSDLAGTFFSPHVLPITLQYVLNPPNPRNPRNSTPASQEWSCWAPVLVVFAGQHLINKVLPSPAVWWSPGVKRVIPCFANHCFDSWEAELCLSKRKLSHSQAKNTVCLFCLIKQHLRGF